MGVPAFFRWLTRKYPSVIVDAVEMKLRDADGNRIPVNILDPNPNFQEFDNLYLDMNGIIHPCTHPEDRPAPQTEDEMFVLIFEYIDRLFAIVRPRRLLYMAIDGVAPRAKMNQQRSRRFRASKETAEKAAQIAEVRAKLEAEGFPLPPKKEDSVHFDSNCITPGTPFMSRLAIALRYYIHKRLSTDPGWQQIEVILSDASVPGEGEHKIMDFIRRQRASSSHDPNTVHCLCGADADLIMLGLATHEPNFNIIREEFIPNQQRPCELCGQYGHEIKDCRGYLTDSGDVNMERVQMILDGLGEVEDEIFKSRQERELSYRRKAKIRRRNERRATAPAYIPSSQSLLAPLPNRSLNLSGSETRIMARDARIQAMHYQQASSFQITSRKRIHEDSDSEEEPYDEVRLWESGWKERYYKSKFEVDSSDIAFRRKVAFAYVEGLCWVLKYYYQGCASWDWYFPYHYAPFASDFDTVSQFVPDFSSATEPFRPLQQLMSVFPAASRQHLPESWQVLMTDSCSPIIDFYPDDFQVDLNGKKYAWQGVALLPFVDEKRLLETLATVEPKLSLEEKERNAKGFDKIFVGSKHLLFNFLKEFYDAASPEEGKKVSLDSSLAHGLAGHIDIDQKGAVLGKEFLSPILHENCSDIKVNAALSATYFDPEFQKGFVFPAKRLAGAEDVPRVLKPNDWNNSEPFHPQIGFSRNTSRGRLSDVGHRMISHEIRRWSGSNQSFYNERLDSRSESSSDVRVQSFSSFMQTSFSPPEYYGEQERYTSERRSGNSAFIRDRDIVYSSATGNRGSRDGYNYQPRPFNSSMANGYEQPVETRNPRSTFERPEFIRGRSAFNDRPRHNAWMRGNRW